MGLVQVWQKGDDTCQGTGANLQITGELSPIRLGLSQLGLCFGCPGFGLISSLAHDVRLLVSFQADGLSPLQHFRVLRFGSLESRPHLLHSRADGEWINADAMIFKAGIIHSRGG